MEKVLVIGGAVTKFGRLLDRNLKSLVAEAAGNAMVDAGITKEQLQGAWVANCFQGILQGQESIRGQVVLREMGIGRIPVVNVENACASGGSAVNAAWAMIALGELDVALVVGMEKMYFEDRSLVMKAFLGGSDVEVAEQTAARLKADEEKIRKEREARGEKEGEKSGQRTVFMDMYAAGARAHMQKYGTTQRQIAAVCSKNHFHSSMNPLAQYQNTFTIEEVLSAVEVVYPLTRPMCAPIGDGAAALILCSESFAKKIGARNTAELAATVIASGEDPVKGKPDTTLSDLAKKAYEKAGVGPEDVSLAEVHDATAFAEISLSEELGLCPVGEGGRLAEAGYTTLGGKLPINVSGGLESQGHPVGATGARQIVELYWHLTGKAGQRQVHGAKVGLAENTGGSVRDASAALSVIILKK